jgi:radical SAM family uncharacterized protein/radical SAM-linked protein
MIRQTFQNILSLVQRPSHYLGSEPNAITKDPAKIRLRFALAFPDLYDIGMSHLGMKILYHILNSRTGVCAERVFAPGEDMEAQLRAKGVPLCSLETRTPLSRFDILGVSLLYELNYTNILTILDLAGIPFFSRERDESHPVVIAGGPCAFNPEPLADFFDAIVVGDGEEVICSLTDSWMDWKKSGKNRKSLLKAWAEIEGVYIPSFFECSTSADGFQVLTPLYPEHAVVRKRIVADLNKAPFPDHPIVPFGKPVHDRLSLEVARGCTRGCRFCQAGMIYRPVRERAPKNLIDLAEKALRATGHDDVSLLSLSTGDYTSILFLLSALMMRCESEKTAVSLPSLRVGTLTPEIMEQIKRVRKTGFTIAVEAGTERLRNVINKNISEQDVIATIENAFGLGWSVIKLYFMIGLPTETEKDLEEIVSLVQRLRQIRPEKRQGALNVCVSTFIPKSHTPFQWSPQISLAESRAKLTWLRQRIKGKGVRFKWHSPEMSILEGLLARGDRRLSSLLVNAYRLGCRLDGWSDKMRFDLWEKAMEISGVDIDFFTTRQRSISEPLCWDHIDSMVTEDYLKDEWKKALQQSSTSDCRTGECNLCGVCERAGIEPVTFFEPRTDRFRTKEETEKKRSYRRLRISYSKRGEAKYFGHLELINIFTRAFRRADIQLKYSQGFHPMPKISFETALPVGIESIREHLAIEVDLKVSPATVVKCLNHELPGGISVIDALPCSGKRDSGAEKIQSYTVRLKNSQFPESALVRFLECDTWPVTKQNRKGRSTQIDLRAVIREIRLEAPDELMMTVNGGSGQSVRPVEAITSIFGFPEEVLRQADILKG